MSRNEQVSPKELLLIGTVLFFSCWQLCSTLIALALFPILKDKYKLKVTLINLFFVLILQFIDIYYLYIDPSVQMFIINGFKKNFVFLKLIQRYDLKLALYYQMKAGILYLIGFPLLIASLLQKINTIYTSPHSKLMHEMTKGKLSNERKLSSKYIDKKISELKDADFDGILLGLSLNTIKPVVMPDYYVNQIVLVLGTTGSGKTVTLNRFFQRAIKKGYPLIIVDGKPTNENINALWESCKRTERNFYGFNCANYKHYNAFALGGYTELKDKIITLKDKWESDYYLSIAEDYLQTTLEILIKAEQRIDLRTISDCLDINVLINYVRELNDNTITEKIKQLGHYQRETLTGLQAHLNMLLNSEMGSYISYHPEAFSLNAIIENNAVVYFALPALKFPIFSKMIGKLIINDIKTAIEPLENKKPIFMVFDEFSVFAGEQVLNLVNMGRGKGVHAVFGTQGVSDLKKVDEEFESQLLNCINTIICHRLNDEKNAVRIAEWIGTEVSYDLTTQINLNTNQASLGSANKNRAYRVHPEHIKQELQAGEIFFASKVACSPLEKIKIKI